MRAPIIIVILHLGLLAASSAPADILVTSDGTKLQTKGSWKIKGRQVIFTNETGVLSAMRLSEIDIEASEVATKALESSAATRAPDDDSKKDARRSGSALAPLVEASEKAEKREAALVVTNADVKKSRPQPGEASAALGSAAHGSVDPEDQKVQLAAGVTLAHGKFEAIRTHFDIKTEAGVRAAAKDYRELAADLRELLKRIPSSESAEVKVWRGIAAQIAGRVERAVLLVESDPQSAIALLNDE